MIKILMFGTLLLISCFFLFSEGSRQISCFVNPGLNVSSEEKQATNVIHIISEGENDTIHFIWSTYKTPSVIVARTIKNTSLSINTTKLISFEKDAILFKNDQPLASVGVTFSKIWELHYDNDSSPLSDTLSVGDLDVESFFWTDVNDTLYCNSSFASVNLKARNNELPFSQNGTFEIQFSVSGEQELSDEFPHLVFTENSTLLKIIFDNLYSNFSFTRYGFGISLFSTLSYECETDIWKTFIYKSINDEDSPGVFSDVELLAPCSDKTPLKSTFMSWRPVAYTGEKPIVANSSDVTMTDLKLHPKFDVHSIAELYFQDKSNVSNFNVTFGTLGDGCYVSTQYTSWSLMIGTGSMVEIPLSKIVVILASVGIGLLMLFLLCGSIFIVYQKCKDRDDDLLLN